MQRSQRIQEWLADHLSWVQYPQVRPANEAARAASRVGWRFRHAMPFGKRLDVLLLSLLLLLCGLIAAGAVGLLAYLLL